MQNENDSWLAYHGKLSSLSRYNLINWNNDNRIYLATWTFAMVIKQNTSPQDILSIYKISFAHWGILTQGVLRWTVNSDTKSLMGLTFATLHVRNFKDFDWGIQGYVLWCLGFSLNCCFLAFHFGMQASLKMMWRATCTTTKPYWFSFPWREVTSNHLANIHKFKPYMVRKLYKTKWCKPIKSIEGDQQKTEALFFNTLYF